MWQWRALRETQFHSSISVSSQGISGTTGDIACTIHTFIYYVLRGSGREACVFKFVQVSHTRDLELAVIKLD